jgi:ATP-dependent helicase/nuclease subunit A
LLAEELRLLYVGMTRARDTLILSSSIAASRLEKLWAPKPALNLERLRSAQSYADWLGFWFAQHCPADSAGANKGQFKWLQWRIHNDSSLVAKQNGEPAPALENNSDLLRDPTMWETLRQRLSWQYAWSSATRQPAKTSVSALRRQAAIEEGETAPARWAGGYTQRLSRLGSGTLAKRNSAQLSAAEIGDLHHRFLQFIDLDQAADLAGLAREAARLQSEGIFTLEEKTTLDLEAVAAFWDSDLGRQIRAHSASVQRELAFTARFSPQELAQFTGEKPDPHLAQEYVVVQGVVDLAVILPQEIWLVDFKTDDLKPAEIQDKVRFYQPQLWTYAQALARTYHRPVSQCWLYFLGLRQAVPMSNE